MRSVTRALAEGRVLRTHVLRPTWHLVNRDDLRWLLALTAPRVLARMARHRQLGLDAEVRRRANRAIEAAVATGPRTREELALALREAGVDPAGQRLPHLLMAAELDAVIVSGPPRGRQQTYAPFDERVPGGPAPDREEALAELARRFFASRGPATLGDLLRWSSLTTAEGRRGLAAVASALARLDAGGPDVLVRPIGRGPRTSLAEGRPRPRLRRDHRRLRREPGRDHGAGGRRAALRPGRVHPRGPPGRTDGRTLAGGPWIGSGGGLPGAPARPGGPAGAGGGRGPLRGVPGPRGGVHRARARRIAASNRGSAWSTISSFAVSEIRNQPGASNIDPGSTHTSSPASPSQNARSSGSGDRTMT